MCGPAFPILLHVFLADGPSIVLRRASPIRLNDGVEIVALRLDGFVGRRHCLRRHPSVAPLEYL